MEQAIKISVLIPAYNVEAYVDQCLESVTNQTLREIEIIVLDDGSTDSTLAHIEAAAEKDPRIRILRHPENLGLFQARKDAVLASRGNYIMFVDADDWLEPNACELVYAQAMESGADIVHYGAVVENCGNLPQRKMERMRDFRDRYLTTEIEQPFVSAWFVKHRLGDPLWQKAVKTAVAKNAFGKLADAEICAAEDTYLTFVLLMESGSLHKMPERLYHYCYGRGACGKNEVSLENFAYHCKAARVCRELDRYISALEKTVPDGDGARITAGRQAAESIRKGLLAAQLKLWLNNVKPADRPAAFLVMEAAWKEAGCDNFVGLLTQYAWHRRKEIAEALAGAAYLKFEGRPVKTIALYYWRIQNGGAERVVSLLARQLAELRDKKGTPRYKVVLVTDEEPQAEDYPVSPLVVRAALPPIRMSTEKDYAPRSEAWARIVAKHQIDAVLYSQWMNPYLLWDLLSIKRTERSPAFVIHAHNWSVKMYGEKSNNVEECLSTYRLADAIVTLSETDRLYWQRINPNTRYIPNPCFVKASETRRAAFGKHILWLGRISIEKQPLEIPRIMREVVARDPEIICHVVGDDDAELRDRLKESIAAEGLSDNIVMEGFHTDVVPYYERSSLFLMTSRFEGFPLTLYEAACFALPTVMYDLPWLAYCDMMDGWVSVPQLDAASAAEAIVRILGDPVEWQQRSDALYRSAQEYEKTDVTAYWTALLDDLETGRLPEGPTLDETTRLMLDQISYFHGEAVRGLIGERDGLECEINKIKSSLAFRFGTLVAMPWRIVRDHVKGRLKQRG